MMGASKALFLAILMSTSLMAEQHKIGEERVVREYVLPFGETRAFSAHEVMKNGVPKQYKQSAEVQSSFTPDPNVEVLSSNENMILFVRNVYSKEAIHNELLDILLQNAQNIEKIDKSKLKALVEALRLKK